MGSLVQVQLDPPHVFPRFSGIRGFVVFWYGCGDDFFEASGVKRSVKKRKRSR
ncbi:hypothetical protein [Candidatus Ichthyocystis hellenicum]|uniref:hypothetical protein n=1 Tax=Candidatus Ichthyocystis hellenicum TaxID=1561003 RepID=UPI0012FDB32D|nr:hypothetical protein [Candidatus Ichthyocystis hellenicum]